MSEGKHKIAVTTNPINRIYFIIFIISTRTSCAGCNEMVAFYRKKHLNILLLVQKEKKLIY